MIPFGIGAEHLAQAAVDIGRLLLFLGIGVAAELDIDADDIVGLAMQQYRIGRMKGWVEPEAPLLGQLALEADIGDQELVAEDLAFIGQSHQVANRTAHPVAGHDIVRRQRVASVGRLDLDRGAIDALGNAHDLVTETHVDRRLGQAAVVEEFLDVILLQIDEGREFLVWIGLQTEAVDRVFAMIDLALLPGDALLDHALGQAEAIPDFQRVLGLADRAAAQTHRIVLVEDNGRHAAQRQTERQRRTGEPRPHDDDGRTLARTLGGTAVGIVLVSVRTHPGTAGLQARSYS